MTAPGAPQSSRDQPLDTYHKLFRKCLLNRVPLEQFESYFNQLLARSPIPSAAIATISLSPAVTCNASDPLHLQYVSYLVAKDIVSLAQLLNALLKTSPAKAPTDDGGSESRGRETLEQDLFLVLANIVRTNKPRNSESVWGAITAVSEWMEVVMASASATSGGGMAGFEDTAMTIADVPTRGRLEALGDLVASLGMNEYSLKVLAEVGKREKKIGFLSSLTLFIQFFQVHDQLAQRLEIVKRSLQTPKKGATSGAIDVMMGLEGSEPIPLAWTRAHLFLWLSGQFTKSPYLEDEAVLGYLYNRYKEDTNEIATALVTAVIDMVSYALLRNEPANTLFLMRSFLTNKVPILLYRLGVISHFAISQAFMQADVASLMNLPTNIFDPASTDTSTSSDMFNELSVDLRQEFLFACALHSVIGEADIQTILGELPLGALPNSGRYNMHDLLTETRTDSDRLGRLLEEIENMDGNSGAVCKALYYVIKNLCENRETMPLRNVCSYLTRKPSCIDVMLLFIKPSALLEPLCELLDVWRYEEDQGEYQPVYEEFGSILLLVLTMIHRHSLPLPPSAFNSFISSILNHSSAARIEALSSSDQHAQLGGWIKEIFEGEGISDGLMSSCLPQHFYRLAPTLFSQSVLALQRNVLDLETIKEAFTFLLEPFILPSLILGLAHLSHSLWASHDPNTLALISHLATASPTAQEDHKTVLSIASRSLLAVLQDMNRRKPTSETQRLIETLRPLYKSFFGNRYPSREEIEMWTAQPGGIQISLQNAFRELLEWNTTPPPAATAACLPRMVETAGVMLGKRKVVSVFLEQVEKRANNNTPSPEAVDVATALMQMVGANGNEVDGPVGAEIARRIQEGKEARWGGVNAAADEDGLGVEGLGDEKGKGLEEQIGAEIMGVEVGDGMLGGLMGDAADQMEVDMFMGDAGFLADMEGLA